MPVNDSTTRTLEIKLGDAGDPIDWSAKYDVIKIQRGFRTYVDRLEACGTVSDGTPVTVIPAPIAADLRHELADFYLVQTRVAQTQVMLHYNDNGTRYLEIDHDLDERDNLRYS